VVSARWRGLSSTLVFRLRQGSSLGCQVFKAVRRCILAVLCRADKVSSGTSLDSSRSVTHPYSLLVSTSVLALKEQVVVVLHAANGMTARLRAGMACYVGVAVDGVMRLRVLLGRSTKEHSKVLNTKSNLRLRQDMGSTMAAMVWWRRCRLCLLRGLHRLRTKEGMYL
jgi:hypothetical protein